MTDDVRRRDTGPSNWGQAGPVRQTHCVGMDNLQGIASVDMRAVESVMTEQGPVILPVGPLPGIGYQPSVAALSVAPFVDSRRTAISDRYYR
jgi:hypothetical protein